MGPSYRPFELPIGKDVSNIQQQVDLNIYPNKVIHSCDSKIWLAEAGSCRSSTAIAGS